MMKKDKWYYLIFIYILMQFVYVDDEVAFRCYSCLPIYLVVDFVGHLDLVGANTNVVETNIDFHPFKTSCVHSLHYAYIHVKL